MTKTKIIFFGNEQLAQGIKAKTPIFDTLLADEHYEICALVLPKAHVRKPFPITIQAQKHHIKIRQVQKGAELLPIIEEFKPEIGVLAAFGKLVPEAAINAIPCGILNIHPSLLPKYRGTTPIETALLNGDDETGVSIMRLAKEMDAGNILAQEKVQITAETTKQSLYEELSALGAKLLLNVMPGTLAKNAPETAQNDAEATFTQKLSKDLALLKPSEKAAKTLYNEVRAYAGFPKSKTVLFDIPCTITQAHVADQASTELDLLCADGKYLIIDRLLPENSKEMDAKSFLNGHKK
ncbi:methionyl-tRNA formyltransferase [Candidatus Saccharibacteria bacterium]|nr:methionyl-tRNA formyltransferase [Candidatus Saccharibacteria bacterium]